MARIAERDPAVNCFTAVTAERALAGVPFAVKNLFDVRGLTTLAGSKINRERPAAARDAAAVRPSPARAPCC